MEMSERRASEAEIAAARAWTDKVTADWNHQLEAFVKEEYERALAVIVFAGDFWASQGNYPPGHCHDPQCSDSTWDHPCPVGPEGWELWRP